MEDMVCPKCGQKLLRPHSILVPDGVRYELECSWCAHKEGDYPSIAEAKKDYEKKYGGNK